MRFLVLTLLFFLSFSVMAEKTKMLSDPAISETHVAFTYADDLWIAELSGANPRRLTTHPGSESHPIFSPDGKSVAFTGEYDGNIDVYIVSAQGGIPKRLTWHPGNDVACDFTPDGSKVLFRSGRETFVWQHTQLFNISIHGGFPEKLALPYAHKASYSKDGTQLVYNPLSESFRQWKNYRGGRISTLWTYQFSDHEVKKISQPKSGCNDVDGFWIGDKVYFLSDRKGEFNIFSYDGKEDKVEQHTNYFDFPITHLASNGKQLVYEYAGMLHTFNPENSESQEITISIQTDLREIRPRYVSGVKHLRSGDISPSGVRATVEYRGEILTVPAAKGDIRNLTQTVGVHERSPRWSPDGNYIAYFSDESGEYQLHIAHHQDRKNVQKIPVVGAGFYEDIEWSPDSKKIAYTDNSWSLYWIDLESKKCEKVAAERLYSPFKTIYPQWSPDSKWLTYTLKNQGHMQQVFLYSLAEKKSYQITKGMSDASEPTFDPSGHYLYFFASNDAGPVNQWFAMSNADMEAHRSIYLLVLDKNLPSPLAKESDEETSSEEKSTKPEFKMDLEDIEHRIVALPVPPGDYKYLQTGNAGDVYYMDFSNGAKKLQKYSLKQRQSQQIANGISSFRISHNNSKFLYVAGSTWGIAPLGPGVKVGTGAIKTGAISVKIDPRAEWRQIYREVWRINRDYFYAKNMHGADWSAMYKKYETFLPHLTTRKDLTRLIRWLCSELAVGHHYTFGGENLHTSTRVAVGLLGADFQVENNRYRLGKIYGGLNWNPNLRSPLTEPGLNVAEGSYVMAVNGRNILADENIYSFFENAVGQTVQITIAKKADGSDSRTISVEPIANEHSLRNRAWIEGNIKKVHQATNGRVAYVYVPNTAGLGHTYFKRYFYPQVGKEALIIDERYNRGGQVADYYIDHMRREQVAYWVTRYGEVLSTPGGSILGPKVMLTDETAGSGGDLLPWMFRKFKLGTIVGKRTWGGLVGILGFPILIDGGYITAPNLAFWTPEDGWAVENEGVAPDVEVEQLPKETVTGRDPQLEKAIEIILEKIGKTPKAKMTIPDYPVRVYQKD